jgi:GYF domain 2
MPDKWFYKHGGAIHGPVSAEQLRALAWAGGLSPDDLIWPLSVEAVAAIRAGAALPFPSTDTAEASGLQPSPLPEWARALIDAGLDVGTLESLPPPPAEAWLDDLHHIEQRADGGGNG